MARHNPVKPETPGTATATPAQPAKLQDMEAGKLLSLYSSQLSGEIKALNTFTNFCETSIAEQTDKLAQLSNKSKPALSAHLQELQSAIHLSATKQAGYLSRAKLLLDRTKTDGTENLQIIFAPFEKSLPTLDLDRENLRKELVQLGVSIDNAALKN